MTIVQQLGHTEDGFLDLHLVSPLLLIHVPGERREKERDKGEGTRQGKKEGKRKETK